MKIGFARIARSHSEVSSSLDHGDSSGRTVVKNGKTITLTPAEFKILEELRARKGDIVSRETLMLNALGYNDFVNDRTLDTHIKNLRKKIESDPKNPEIIKTVRDAGFRFCMA